MSNGGNQQNPGSGFRQFAKDWGLQAVGAIGGAVAIATLSTPANAIVGGGIVVVAVATALFFFERRRPQALGRQLRDAQAQIKELQRQVAEKDGQLVDNDGQLAELRSTLQAAYGEVNAQRIRANTAEASLVRLKERMYDVVQRNAQLVGKSYVESWTWTYTVGQSNEGDRSYEAYTTRPLDGKTVLYRRIETHSNTAMRAAGHQLSFGDLGFSLQPSDRARFVELLKRNCPDDAVGLIVFEPEIGPGDQGGLKWSVEYALPGAFDDLRVKGEDTVSFILGPSTEEATVTFVFPIPANQAMCTVQGPVGVATQQPALDSSRGPNHWTWQLGPKTSGVDRTGQYKFTLRMPPPAS